MPFLPMATPAPIAVTGPVTSVSVDTLRHRIAIAARGAHAVAIVDAISGVLLATLHTVDAQSVAVEPLGGHVFAGTARGRIVDIDPERHRIVRTLELGEAIGAMRYDAVSGRLYADAAVSPKLWVVDVRTFALVATVMLPGKGRGDIALDPITHDVYQSIAQPAGIAVIDAVRNAVRETFPTPELSDNRVLVFDDALGLLVAAGRNGLMSVYDRAGLGRGKTAIPAGIDACDVDTHAHLLACTGGAAVTIVQLRRISAPVVLDPVPVADASATAFIGDTRVLAIFFPGVLPGGTSMQRFAPDATLRKASPSP